MEPIIEYLRRHLAIVGPAAWEAIAEELSAGKPEKERVSVHLLRKIAYGDRSNPGVAKVQPLLDYFHAREPHSEAAE